MSQLSTRQIYWFADAERRAGNHLHGPNVSRPCERLKRTHLSLEHCKDEAEVMLNRIHRIRSVFDHTGLSRSTLYRKIGQGTFPPPVQISERGIGWRELELERWLADPARYRSADRDEER